MCTTIPATELLPLAHIQPPQSSALDQRGWTDRLTKAELKRPNLVKCRPLELSIPRSQKGMDNISHKSKSIILS